MIDSFQVLRIKTRDGIPSHDITEIYANDNGDIKLISGAMTYNNFMLAGSVFDKTILCEVMHV